MNEGRLLRKIIWNRLTADARAAALRRPALRRAPERAARVRSIIARVRRGGDAAVLALGRELDGCVPSALRVPREHLNASLGAVAPETLKALRLAAERIRAFHQLEHPVEPKLDRGDGIVLRRKAVPIESVGLYVPAGEAPLASTVLMLAIPAKLAGCPLTTLCSPPGADGEVNPLILAAARLAGVDVVIRAGGAQAIAALAYGTRSVPKVDKIFGPGNAWVAEAKLQVDSDPSGAAADLPAGPSEVMVVTDGSCDPAFAAADLLSQAEHGPDSQVSLVAMNAGAAAAVERELRSQLAALPRRKIARQSLKSSFCAFVRRRAEALEVVEAYAPEHLILHVSDARGMADEVRSAGSVFIGPWTPEASGDYATGANHVLPTYGTARSYSGLSVDSFRRYVTLQELTPAGLRELGPTVSELARCEGLDGHRRAVAVRLDSQAALAQA